MNEKERLIKAVNSYEYFENNKDKLIDLFVSYYGEEERTNIETKFKNAIFIAYQTPKSYLTKLHKLENIVSKELVAKVLEENSLGLTQEQVVNYNSFEYINTHPISKYIEFYKQYSLGENGRKEKTTQDVLELVRNYNSNITKEELLDTIKKEQFSRIPVYDETIDNVVGVLNVKDLILLEDESKEFNVMDYTREPFYTFEFKKVSELFTEMKKTRNHMAVVLDEYGGTVGIVTMEDLV